MRRLGRWMAALALAGMAGCARPAGTIFARTERPWEWPPPPDAPRIRFLGSLASDADLKPARSGWEVFTESVGGPRPARGVSTPAGVAVSANEKVIVCDPAQRAVHVFDLRTRRYASLSDAGDQSLFTPAGVATRADEIFVTDSTLHGVFVFDMSGKFVRLFGVDRLARPVGVACGGAPDSPRLYVVDAKANACVIFSADGREMGRFGRRGSGPGEFNSPTFAAVDGHGQVFVVDSLNSRVQRFTPDGEFVATIGTRGDGAGTFALPKGIAVDAAGRVYVVDAQFENVQIFSPQGELLMAFGREGHGPGEFWLPSGAAVGADGRLWIADSYNRRIQAFDILKETL